MTLCNTVFVPFHYCVNCDIHPLSGADFKNKGRFVKPTPKFMKQVGSLVEEKLLRKDPAGRAGFKGFEGAEPSLFFVSNVKVEPLHDYIRAHIDSTIRKYQKRIELIKRRESRRKKPANGD